MKNSITHLILLFGVFHVSTLSAQWTKTNGLPGGDFSHFAQVGDTTFALHGAGIYCSTNSGLSWQNLLTYKWYWSAGMVSDGHSLLVQRYDADPLKRLLRSDDAGQTWQPVPVPDSLSINTEIVAGQWVLVGTPDGTFRTGDGGTSWELVQASFNSLRYDGHRVFGLNSNGLWASDDFGLSWKVVIDLFKASEFTLKDSVVMVYHYHEPNRITVSKDYGQTWEAYLPTLPSNVRFDQMYNAVWHKGEVYGFWGDEIFKTDDFGKTWEATPLNKYWNYNGHSVEENLLVCGGANGVLRSNDSGNSWSAANNGLVAQSPTHLRVFGNHLFAPATEGIYSLLPDGENWELPQLDIGPFWAFTPFIDYAELGNSQITTFGESPWVSIDGGTTWTESTIPGLIYGLGRIETAGGKVIGWDRATSFGAFYVSENQGLTFQYMTSLQTQHNTFILQLENDNGTLYALSADSRLFQSTDGGDNWMAVGTSIPTNLFGEPNWFLEATLFVRSNSIFLFSSSFDNLWMLFSNDLGQTWQLFDKLATGLPWGSGIFNDLVKANDYLIAATSEGIVYSSDAGLTWTDWNDGFSNPVASRLCVHDGYLWAAMNSDGVWKRPLAELPPVAVGQPETTRSLAIFPNPTCEQFTVQTNGVNGWLTVRDLLGRVVLAEKTNGKNATIPCQNWPAGIYNITFDNEGKRAVGHLLVQK